MLGTKGKLDYEAFLNADVEEDVFVKITPGFEVYEKLGVPLVMKLNKNWYGLRQSQKNRFGTMDVELAVIGLRPLKSALYVYIDFVILKLYVYIGFAITISQKDCTEDVVQRYGMEGYNPTYTSGVGPELSLNQSVEKLLNDEEKRRYQAITGGAVMYLAQVTRYDSLYAVNQLARAMSEPAKAHMGAAKHLLRYLAGSTDFSITYKQDGFRLAAFSDDNRGNNLDNGRCT